MAKKTKGADTPPEEQETGLAVIPTEEPGEETDGAQADPAPAGEGEAYEQTDIPAAETLFDEEFAEQAREQNSERYQILCAGVRDLAAMTECNSWKVFANEIKKRELECQEKLVTEDKTREMIHFQESVRIYRDVLKIVSQPLQDLVALYESLPNMVKNESPIIGYWDETELRAKLYDWAV